MSPVRAAERGAGRDREERHLVEGERRDREEIAAQAVAEAEHAHDGRRRHRDGDAPIGQVTSGGQPCTEAPQATL